MTEATTQVERVARALARHNHPGGSERDIDEMWEGWTGEATAAIKAMSEPTLDMLEAGRAAYKATRRQGASGMTIEALIRAETVCEAAAYRAMIAAALAPQPHIAPIPHGVAPQVRDEVERLREALRPFVEGATHTMVFLTSREKMHSCGVDLYREDVERARAALSPPLS